MTMNLKPGIVGLSALLGACGVTLDATRISSEGNSAPRAIPAGGIVYALPKTEFEILQPVKLTVSGNGPLQEIIEPCRRACDANRGTVSDDSCTFSTAPKVTYLPPELHTLSVADLNRLYRISPDADLFQSLDFKFDIASNGVLDKADTAASNMGYEVLASIASTAVKVLAGRASPVMAAELKKTTQGNRSCYEVSTEVTKLVESEKRTLDCSLMNEIRGCMTGFEQAVNKARTNLNTLFDDAAKSKMDSRLLAALAANRKERIEAEVARFDEAAAVYGLGEAKGKEATYQLVIPVGGPAEFVPFSPGRTPDLGGLLIAGKLRIIGTSDSAPALLPTLSKSLQESKRSYLVRANLPAGVATTQVDESAVGGGYRYRVPVLAETTLEVMDKGKVVFGPLVESRAIAQYGPIAALPSKFKGKGGHVLVKHWPDTGGLQTVQIGAEPIPSTAVTGVIDEAYTQYKARKDRAAAAATAAAATDSELDGLTRQQKILALKKQIKELEEALK
jgi:hypothetical protein